MRDSRHKISTPARGLRALATNSWVFISLTVAVSLPGCSHGNITREAAGNPDTRPIDDTHQGSSWDTVLPAPAVDRSVAGISPEYLPEYGRRDSLLAMRGQDNAYPLDSWPAPRAPSVFHSRRIRVSTNADNFYLFDYPHYHVPYRDRRRP
ncbi:MAG: hypothetical protein KF787_11405 [Phycisphaeraceae bacterium]|nr:hypothetical protein [Phycisphaeraceae bacterium]